MNGHRCDGDLCIGSDIDSDTDSDKNEIDLTHDKSNNSPTNVIKIILTNWNHFKLLEYNYFIYWLL